MRETQVTIEDWRRKTFGEPSTNARIAARANEEMAELLRALTTDESHPKALEECADIVIVLFGVAEGLGGDLLAEVDRKMGVNRARQWRMSDTGHGHHIPDAAE